MQLYRCRREVLGLALVPQFLSETGKNRQSSLRSQPQLYVDLASETCLASKVRLWASLWWK